MTALVTGLLGCARTEVDLGSSQPAAVAPGEADEGPGREGSRGPPQWEPDAARAAPAPVAGCHDCGDDAGSRAPIDAQAPGRMGNDAAIVADADGDGVSDPADLCPLGDDHIDHNGNGFADACEQLLATTHVSTSPQDRRAATLADVTGISFEIGYDAHGPTPSGIPNCPHDAIVGEGHVVDVGYRGSYVIAPELEPDYDALLRCLTDGENQWLSKLANARGGGGGGGLAPEENALEGRTLLSGPDLYGARVLFIRVEVMTNVVRELDDGLQVVLAARWDFVGYRE